ncbi:hypothetical protein ACMH5Q_09610 [Aquirufa lenticrescens]
MKKLLVLICLIASFTTLAQENLKEIKHKAYAHSAEGLHEEALKYFLQVLKLEPNGSHFGQVGFELMSLERDDEAKPYLKNLRHFNCHQLN